MSEQLSDQKNVKYGIGVKTAVLSIIVVEYFTSIVTPALSAMNKTLAAEGASTELVKQIQSLPNLTMVVMGLFVGILVKYVPKKTLLYIGMALIFIGGLMPFFGGNIYVILVWRAVLGLGRGVCFPFAMSFIVDLFQGEERNRLMGLRSSVGGIASIIFLQFGGLVATVNWRYCFLGYLLVIPIIVLVAIKLPEPPRQPEPEGVEKQEKISTITAFTGQTWMIILLNIILMFATYSFMTNMSLVVAERGIGSTADAANIMSIFGITMTISGFIFAIVFKRLFKKFTTQVAMILLGLGLLVCANATGIGLMIVGAILFGFGFQIYNANVYLNLSLTVKSPNAAASAISWFMAFNGIGQFGSNLVLDPIAKALGLTSALGGWQIAGPFLTVVGIVCFIVIAFTKRKDQPAKAA